MITGKDLINAGIKPGRWFKDALAAANAAGDDWVEAAKAMAPAQLELNDNPPDYFVNIDGDCDNVKAVKTSMDLIMKTPVVKAGAIMPDVCPAGPLGTIPVGGVVASTEIHPGMHSADICCSVMLTNLGNVNPSSVLDISEMITHFGYGGRKQGSRVTVSYDLLKEFEGNKFLCSKQIMQAAQEHMGTQGDGNHFLFVGTLKSTGETCLVTHHGSRKPGALLYKAGMVVAEKCRKEVSPKTLKQNAWIPPEDKEEYWSALQIIRKWTKANHNFIHQRVCDWLDVKHKDRFWNEHNFVFKRDDRLFYHAKGATPAFDGWAEDATDLTLIPLNMSEPVLIVRGKNKGIGFSPHGAGRNYSRTAHKKTIDDFDAQIKKETEGLDVRFYCGTPDVSELPSAYKDAQSVRDQIKKYDLAEIVDEVLPYGCIMAGDCEANAPWRKKK